MKIVVGGQMDKQRIVDLVTSLGGDTVEATAMTDINAAMAVKNGNADYYIGACNTGGGGALAMAVAILGYDKTATLGMPGKIMSDEEIVAQVEAGKLAFGFTAQDIDHIVPILMKALLEKNQ